VQDIQPVVMTYESTRPMIPLRLTAVAANPNMNVVTWIFADSQAYTTNYARPVIRDEHLRGSFGSPDGTNYLALVDMTVDLYQGRAFITEYAQPTSALISQGPDDALLIDLVRRYDYVTRFFGRISPEEMTVDPMFDLDPDLPDVSNIHDLSRFKQEAFWGCEELSINIEYDPSVVPKDSSRRVQESMQTGAVHQPPLHVRIMALFLGRANPCARAGRAHRAGRRQ
jgi:hypothetical protein